MSRHILFFINPVSGTSNKRKLEEGIILSCTERGIAFQILFTSADGNYSFLSKKIKDDEITDVVICGGDGSLRAVIAAILQCNVSVGIIPRGSGNGLARTVGIPLNFKGAMEVIFNGHTRLTDAIMINDELSCHLSGWGFDAEIAHRFARQKRRGLKTYVKEVFKHFFSLKSHVFEMSIGDKKLTEEAFCVCIANSNQFGNNFKIAPQASVCDGVMDVVILRKSGRITALISVARQVFTGELKAVPARDLKKQKTVYFQTQQLHISNPDLAPMHIDGDPVDTQAGFSIKVLPAAYRLLQPGN